MPSVHDAYQMRKEERRKRWGDLAKRRQCAHVDTVTRQKCQNYLGVNKPLKYTLCRAHAPQRCQVLCPSGRRCLALLHPYHVHCDDCGEPNDDGEDHCIACTNW